MRSAEGRNIRNNNRGVALLIALLVTTLLMALIVEFTYATRVSLRAAVNFRDSQRAYYLARSGVNFAGKLLAEYLKQGKPQDKLEQRDLMPVPFVSEGDTILTVTWEDEAGKINIGPQFYNSNLDWFRELLTNTGVSQEVVGKIEDATAKKIFLLDQLHQAMSDEEYDKVRDFLTTSNFSAGAINVNTASEKVLRSVLNGKTASADFILMKRKDKPIPDLADTDINIPSRYTTNSNTFRVFSYATVGGYTKQAEAVIMRSAGGFTILYWKIL